MTMTGLTPSALLLAAPPAAGARAAEGDAPKAGTWTKADASGARGRLEEGK